MPCLNWAETFLKSNGPTKQKQTAFNTWRGGLKHVYNVSNDMTEEECRVQYGPELARPHGEP
jgi:hypothetical protein